jgi:hypothetical protein
VLRSSHRFYIHVRGEGGASVCRQETSGFPAVFEDVLFTAVRAGFVPNDERPPEGTLEPVWSEGRVSGFAASLAGVTKTYPLGILKHEVHELLLRPGLVQLAGEETPVYQWSVEAEPAAPPEGRRLPVRLRRRPYPFVDGAPPSLGVALPHGVEGGALRLYVAAGVLAQLCGETAASLGVERADILCGSLLRDRGGAALVVTGRFPMAFQTEASAAHVAFSPLTFQAAQQEHLRRGSGESLVGWHHNHPPKCGRDCLAVVPPCDDDSVFCSLDDYAVFLASFSSAHMVGLISGKGKGRRADDPVVRAYGWQDGVVREIPFTVFEG